MSEDEYSESKLPEAVVAIDFGTTYTGYAYSFRNEFKKSRSNYAGLVHHNSWTSGLAGQYSLKAPTVALFNSNKEFDCFGYEAEEKYAKLTEDKVHSNWYYFRRFKMELFDKMKLSRDLVIADQLGKDLPAIHVFSECIKYIVKAAKKEFVNAGHDSLDSENSIIWVITVPAIWNEPAKQFMKEAAIKAGIDKDKLMLALEPEAAALYCRYLPGKEANDIRSYFHGGRYMVVDMGGGTVDIAVHEVSGDGKSLTEILPASGGAWGGDNVNQTFINFFGQKVGGEKEINKIKKQRTSHWLKLERSFEETKRKLKSDTENDIRLEIPQVIIIEAKLDINLANSYKMDIHNEDFKSFFDSTNHTINHMTEIMAKIPDIELILLVGGYAQSDYVSNLIKSEFRSKKILVPTKAEVAVMEGAVLFGFEPWSVSARMCRHTYGIDCHTAFIEGVHRKEYRTNIDGEDKCDNIFSIVATEGDVLQIAEKRVKELSSSHKSKNRRNITINIPFYASTDKSCQYTTNESCKRIGNISVEPPADGWPEKVHYRVEMYFGRTELKVKVFDDIDEREYNGKFDFLIEKDITEVLPVSQVTPAKAQGRTEKKENNCTLC